MKLITEKIFKATKERSEKEITILKKIIKDDPNLGILNWNNMRS